jgi:hypothetical protein
MTFRATFRAPIRQFLLRVYPPGRFRARPGGLQLVSGIALTSPFLSLATGAILAVRGGRRQTFATLLGLAIGVSYATCAKADQFALYSNTQDTQTATGFGGTNNNVLIDDVLVPSSRNLSMRPLAITSVSVFVSGLPGDEDVLSLWNYPVERDGAPGFARTLIDTASVTLPSFPFAVVTFGNGSTPLFTVSPDDSIEPGFGLFFLGLGSSRVANWQWADGPDVNRPTAYNHRLDVDRIFLNTSPGPPFPSHVSYYLRIEGSPVPEPSTLTQIAASLLVGSVLISLAPRESRRAAGARAPARSTCASVCSR